MFRLYFTFAFIFLMVFYESTCQQAGTRDEPTQQWTGYRGPLASGVLYNADLPENWNVKESKNVKWLVAIPGLGLSCPVIWENKVFITSAISRTDSSGLKTGIFGDVESVDDNAEHEWKIFCFEKSSGRLIWENTAFVGVPKIRRHPKSTHANCTVTTDGRYVVAFFGSEGLYCFDMDGQSHLEKGFWNSPVSLLFSTICGMGICQFTGFISEQGNCAM